MKKHWMVLAMICGCSSEEQPAKPVVVDGWEMTVSAPAISGTSVSGSFTTKGDGMRGFGACLVADLYDGKECTTADDCATGMVAMLGPDQFPYCLAPKGQAKSTCWLRGPDTEWCNKVPPPGRTAGTYMTPSVAAAAKTGTTRWMTVGCLNAGTYPMFSDGPFPPCASGDPIAANYSAHPTSAVTSYNAP